MTDIKNILNKPGKKDGAGEKKPNMLWYKYLIYFGIWFAALKTAALSAVYFTGFIHMINTYISGQPMYTEMLYDPVIYGFKLLPVIDKTYGVFLAVMAIYQVVIGLLLIKKKSCAGINLVVMTTLMCLGVIMYDCFFCLDVPILKFVQASIHYPSLGQTVIYSLIAAAVIGGLNFIYFRRRKSIFNNKTICIGKCGCIFKCKK